MLKSVLRVETITRSVLVVNMCVKALESVLNMKSMRLRWKDNAPAIVTLPAPTLSLISLPRVPAMDIEPEPTF